MVKNVYFQIEIHVFIKLTILSNIKFIRFRRGFAKQKGGVVGSGNPLDF